MAGVFILLPDPNEFVYHSLQLLFLGRLLAAMSCFRSDNVTKSGAFKAFEARCVKGVTRVFQGCYKGVSRML